MPRPRNSFRSDLTYILLLILRNSLAPTKFISLVTGESSRKVSRYLTYLKRRGLVDYQDGFWLLTRKGEALVDKLFKSYSNIYHLALLINQLKNNINEDKMTTKILKNTTLNYKNTTETLIFSSRFSSKTTKTPDEVLARADRLARKYLGRSLNNIEKMIIRFLAEYFIDTEKKYWLPEDSRSLAEGLAEAVSRFTGSSISSIDVSYALMALDSAGIIYMRKDSTIKKPKIRISRKILGE